MYRYIDMMVPTQFIPAGRTVKDIAASLEAGVRDGLLQAGELLPSVRGLAAQLDVAPGTVATAYKLLRDRGFLDTNGRHGTQVTQRPQLTTRAGTPCLAADVVDLAGGEPDPALLPELPPMTATRTAAAPGAPVLPALHDLARRQFERDGIPGGSLTVTSGGLDAIQRILTARLRAGDTVAIEDPGWPSVLDLVATLGLRPHPLALDADGPRPEALSDALRAGARAVIVTTRAQNPTGVSLTAGRATELRCVLAGSDQTLVVEDDHCAPLTRVEPATLTGSTTAWAVVRSMSKAYGPDLRLAIVAADDLTIARVDERLRVGAGWVSTVLQRAVVELWSDPATSVVIDRAADAYELRRTQLITALAERGIAATGRTGLNVWIPVDDETTAVAGLMQSRWAVAPGSRFRQRSRPGIRVTVSGLAVASISGFADDLAAVLADDRRRHTT